MSPKDDLLFAVADSLNMTLHLMNDHYRSSEKRKFSIGPWVGEERVTVCSDILGLKRVSFFIRVTDRVWLYLVVDSDASTILYVLDAKPLGLTPASMSTYGGVSVSDTLGKIGAAIKARYTFNLTTHTWSSSDAISSTGVGKAVKV